MGKKVAWRERDVGLGYEGGGGGGEDDDAVQVMVVVG